MTSSIPNRRYARGLRRLGHDGRATDFFDEHVLADAVHENIAAVDLAGRARAPGAGARRDIIWGARCLVLLEARWARHAARRLGRRAQLAPRPLEALAPLSR